MKRRSNINHQGKRTLRMRLDAGGRPATLDAAARSVGIVAATETDKVQVFDWELGWVPEILLLSGCREAGQVPLLDTHSRESVADVLGSVREFQIAGDELLARAFYSTDPAADAAFIKTGEGHLTDYSAGYRVYAYLSVAAGETATYEGRTFTGPCLVAVDWEIREVSTCPIGADNRAKARSLVHTNQEEEIMLKEFLRKMRGELGLPEEATEDQVRAAIMKNVEAAARLKDVEARAAAEPKPAEGGAGKPAAAPDASEAARKAVADERERTGEITALCEAHGCRELAAEMIRTGTPVADAQRQVLDEIKKRGGAPAPGFRVEVTATEREKFRAAAEAGLLLRAGVKAPEGIVGADELRGYTLREMAREALIRCGVAVAGNPLEMVGRALTTSDLPNILANVANKSLMAGFAAQPETYQTWVDDTGSLADFKQADLSRRGEVSNLQEVKEGGEFKYGITTDTKEVVKLATYGEIVPISRQAIINDDLGSLTDIPKDMGEAVSRLLGDLAYGVLIANANMGDGVALFHATHGNLASAAAAVDVTSLNVAVKSMASQKDLLGKRRLNIRPVFFIGPVSIMGTVEQFFKTDKIGGVANKPNLANIYSGEYFTRVYDARLDDDSITAWYLAAAKGKTVKMFYLNGMKTPFMEQRTGWSVDGVELKVRMDAAAKALMHQGLFKNTGA